MVSLRATSASTATASNSPTKISATPIMSREVTHRNWKNKMNTVVALFYKPFAAVHASGNYFFEEEEFVNVGPLSQSGVKCDFDRVGARPRQFEVPAAKPFSQTSLQAHRDRTRLRAEDFGPLADLRAVAGEDNAWRFRVEF